MKTQSAKAKGRKLQQWMRDSLIDILGIHPEDIDSASMGAGGEDVIMARVARKKFPYSVECKNQQAVNVWKSYQQAESKCGKYEPLLVIKRNRTKPLVLVDAEHFINLFKDKDEEDKNA